MATRVQCTAEFASEVPGPKPSSGRQRADCSELHDGPPGRLKLETTKGPVEFLVIDLDELGAGWRE
jgi:hypothetical protein